MATKNTAAGKEQVQPKSFEEAMGELEAILAEIERGEVSLEESLKKYERGTFLIQHCRKVLAEAERQVEVLTRGESGELKTEPM
jgi:exodeoxyribonuclease VII small subunit